MPAAAVIPAPIAYIKVVAVKKLVVEFLAQAAASALTGGTRQLRHPSRGSPGLNWSVCGPASFTVKKSECFKQACRLDTSAWNNKIGLRCYFVGCVPE